MSQAAGERIQQRDFISSLAKGLEVLCAFDRETPTMSTADLAAKLGISRASARRFLLTLTELGYLSKRGQRFEPTSKVLSLSSAFLASTPLAAVAQPHLEAVTRRCGESCSLGILEHDMLVFLARSQSDWILNLGLRPGSQLPAYCTAMGRVLLGAWPDSDIDRYLETVELHRFNARTVTGKGRLRRLFAEAREQGYSIVDQELEQGLRAIAVPVVQDGRTVASISISSQPGRATLRRLREEFLPALRAAASAIGGEISRR
jgi:IclR family pca regulon transcriptional regulator